MKRKAARAFVVDGPIENKVREQLEKNHLWAFLDEKPFANQATLAAKSMIDSYAVRAAQMARRVQIDT